MLLKLSPVCEEAKENCCLCRRDNYTYVLCCGGEVSAFRFANVYSFPRSMHVIYGLAVGDRRRIDGTS